MLNAFRRMIEKAYLAVFKPYDMVFYTDLSQSNEKPMSPPVNITVESVFNESQIPYNVMQALIKHVGKEIIIHQVRERFSSEATLWVIRSGGNLAGYVWSAGRSEFGPYYFPIGENDVFLFDGAVLEDYRGKNIYPVLLSNVLYGLKTSGKSRAYYDAHSWNEAVIRSFMKVKAKKLGIVKKYRIGRKHYIVWKD